MLPNPTFSLTSVIVRPAISLAFNAPSLPTFLTYPSSCFNRSNRSRIGARWAITALATVSLNVDIVVSWYCSARACSWESIVAVKEREGEEGVHACNIPNKFARPGRASTSYVIPSSCTFESVTDFLTLSMMVSGKSVMRIRDFSFG